MTAADLAALEGLTLAEVRDWLRGRVADGEHCPCCGQFAKVYRRRINAQMARALIAMFRYDTRPTHGWMHLPTVLDGRRSDEGKLGYWGLIVEETARRPDGGRSGWWQITDRGRLYVLDAFKVPRYALIYDSRVLGYDGPHEGIREALGQHFDYAELMAA